MSEENDLQTENEEPEDKQSHTDKIISLVSEPGAMFAKAAKYPIETIDWLLPVVVILLATILSSILVLSVPEIKMEVKQKARTQMEKRFEEQMKKGTSADEIARARDIGEKQIDYIGSPVGLAFQAIPIFIVGFIIFFVITGFYFVLFKYGFKAELGFKQVMFVNGIVGYISAVNILIVAVISLILKKSFTGLNAAMFSEADPKSFGLLLLSKLDPLTIIAYVLMGVGFAKFAKAEKSTNYIAGVIISWLGISILWFFLVNNVPFLMLFRG